MTFEKDIPWIRLNGVSSEALGEARRQIHNAVQWLARFSRSYLPPSADDSHTSLTWNHIGDSFDTGVVVTNNGKISLGLDFVSLSIEAVTEFGVVLDRIELDGKSDRDLERELVSSFGLLGFDTGAFQTDLPYSLGKAKFAEEDRYDKGIVAQALPELARYFANADSILEYIASLRPDAGLVRCWPHHFDIATLITIEASDDPEEMKSIGVGLSPGDQTYDEPYFYVTPWPYPDTELLPALESPAFWHTDGFVAVVALAEVMQGDGAATRTTAILGEAIRHCENLLRN